MERVETGVIRFDGVVDAERTEPLRPGVGAEALVSNCFVAEGADPAGCVDGVSSSTMAIGTRLRVARLLEAAVDGPILSSTISIGTRLRLGIPCRLHETCAHESGGFNLRRRHLRTANA